MGVVLGLSNGKLQISNGQGSTFYAAERDAVYKYITLTFYNAAHHPPPTHVTGGNYK